ncbi:hypothetical protein ACI2IY_04665 [Lysobacter enzymogenes]|uniref:hypothetical protein n=1 Tax=Lysobacter enzymogenes TaxID=69 RepID=UPI00384B1C08
MGLAASAAGRPLRTTIASKGRRRIVVDAQAYRWSVRPRPTCAQGLGAPLSVAAQSADAAHGQVLHLTLDAARPDAWLPATSVQVGPALVGETIRCGLAAGWTPTAPGSALALHFPAS